jgi:hypothetical protein
LLIYVALLAAIYALVAISWLVIPIIGRFGEVLLGTSIFPHDSFLNAGILEWGFRALGSARYSLFDWTAGFPLTNTLAVGENLIGWQLLYSPLRAIGVSVAAAYNILILVSLVVSGVGTALLERRLGGDKAAGLIAGFIFAFGPFHLDHMLHVQTMGVCFSPFAILFLDRYLEQRLPRDAVGLAGTFVFTALCSVYFAVFLAIVLPLYTALCWIFRRYRFDARALEGLAATAMFAAAILTPLISHYLRFNRSVGYHHSATTLAAFSMEATSILRVPDWQTFWSWSPLARVSSWQSAASYTPAFPGIAALALAVYAIVRGARNPARRPVTLILVALAAVSFLLALGPLLKVVGAGPVPGARWLPLPGQIWLLIPGIRWPMRIFFFAWLAGAILAGFGVRFLVERSSLKWQRVIPSLALFLIAIEFWPNVWLAGRSAVAPEPLQLSDAYPILSMERDRGGVVELPTANESGWRTPYSTRYIYASSGHLRRVVAIHGSVTPPLTDSLLHSANALPDSNAMRFLSAHGVTRVVVHRSLMPEKQGAALVADIERAGYPVIFAGREGVVFATIKGGTVYAK